MLRSYGIRLSLGVRSRAFLKAPVCESSRGKVPCALSGICKYGLEGGRDSRPYVEALDAAGRPQAREAASANNTTDKIASTLKSRARLVRGGRQHAAEVRLQFFTRNCQPDSGLQPRRKPSHCPMNGRNGLVRI